MSVTQKGKGRGFASCTPAKEHSSFPIRETLERRVCWRDSASGPSDWRQCCLTLDAQFNSTTTSARPVAATPNTASWPDGETS